MEQHSIEQCRCPSYLENCPECLVFSLDGSGHSSTCRSNNPKSSVRASVHGQISKPIFKMRIENPKDELHILNKKSGMFEVC